MSRRRRARACRSRSTWPSARPGPTPRAEPPAAASVTGAAERVGDRGVARSSPRGRGRPPARSTSTLPAGGRPRRPRRSTAALEVLGRSTPVPASSVREPGRTMRPVQRRRPGGRPRRRPWPGRRRARSRRGRRDGRATRRDASAVAAAARRARRRGDSFDGARRESTVRSRSRPLPGPAPATHGRRRRPDRVRGRATPAIASRSRRPARRRPSPSATERELTPAIGSAVRDGPTVEQCLEARRSSRGPGDRRRPSADRRAGRADRPRARSTAVSCRAGRCDGHAAAWQRRLGRSSTSIGERPLHCGGATPLVVEVRATVPRPTRDQLRRDASGAELQELAPVSRSTSTPRRRRPRPPPVPGPGAPQLDDPTRPATRRVAHASGHRRMPGAGDEAGPPPTTGSSRWPTTSARAYLRYSFTKGTDQEVGFLVDALGLAARHAGARRRLRARPARPRAGRPGHRGGRRRHRRRFVDAGRTRRAARGHVRAGRRPPARLRRRVRRRHLAVPGRVRAGRRPGARLDGDAAVLAGIARALRPGGVGRGVGLLRLLPGALPGGPRHLRRRRRRQPRADRGARRGRHPGARRPVDHLLHAAGSCGCWRRPRG